MRIQSIQSIKVSTNLRATLELYCATIERIGKSLSQRHVVSCFERVCFYTYTMLSSISKWFCIDSCNISYTVKRHFPGGGDGVDLSLDFVIFSYTHVDFYLEKTLGPSDHARLQTSFRNFLAHTSTVHCTTTTRNTTPVDRVYN